MSIPALLELNGELKRLAAAGAAVAADDFRVRRLIPALIKSGASLPVFARIAELAEKLTAEEEPDRAARLLELVNLVNAVLATQGKAVTAAGGDFVPLDSNETETTSFLTYLKLKPIQDALTQSSSGRMEVLRRAEADGAFKDFRLAVPLVAALSDSFSEVSSFAVQRLADYGAGIVQYLKRGFEAEGGKPHSRRVVVISKACGAAENDWYRSVAEEGEGPVKAEAVYALRHCAENEDILLSFTFDRKKEVREAAYNALGFFGSEAVSKRFTEAFDSRDRVSAMPGISRCAAASLTEHLMRRVDALLSGLVQNGRVREAELKKERLPYAGAEVAALSDALEALRHKTHPDLLSLYVSMERFAAHMTWLTASPDTGLGTVARQWAWNVLYLGAICPDGSIDASAGPPERFALLDAQLGRFNNYFIDYSFAAAVVSESPQEVYDRYSPVLKAGKKDEAASELIEVFLCVLDYSMDIPARERYATLKSVEIIQAEKPAWDARWLDLFIEIDAGELTARMARREHGKCGEYLTGKLAQALQNPREEGGPWIYVAGLIQMRHEKAAELALNALETRLAAKDYLPKYDASVLRLLPGGCAGRLMELAAQYDDGVLAEIAERLSPVHPHP